MPIYNSTSKQRKIRTVSEGPPDLRDGIAMAAPSETTGSRRPSHSERIEKAHPSEGRLLSQVYGRLASEKGYVTLETLERAFEGRIPRGTLAYLESHCRSKKISEDHWTKAYESSSVLEKRMLLRLVARYRRREADRDLVGRIALERRQRNLDQRTSSLNSSGSDVCSDNSESQFMSASRRFLPRSLSFFAGSRRKHDDASVSSSFEESTADEPSKHRDVSHHSHHHEHRTSLSSTLSNNNHMEKSPPMGQEVCLAWGVLSYTSPLRIAWDISMAVLLVYIAITTPFLYAFGPKDRIICYNSSAWRTKVDLFIDCCFMLDIALNFMTSYADHRGTEVTSRPMVVLNYFRTWFLLDAVSTVPFDCVTSGMPVNLQPAKLFKLSKITKVFRFVRISKVVKLTSNGSLSEKFENFFVQSSVLTCLKVFNILFFSAVICHWLACLMAVSGPGFLREYAENQSGDGDHWNHQPRRYLAALYWAVTTMTTVGFGDIVAHSDSERAAAILAMILGGAFYGFVIAEMSSIVLTRDVKTRRFFEKIDTIKAWLEHHEFPITKRDKVMRYVRAHYRQRTALDEHAILDELSPEIREELAQHLVPREIMAHPLFDSLPTGTLAHIAPIIVPVRKAAMEVVVAECDPGEGLFVIARGEAIQLTRLSQSDDSDDLEEMDLLVDSTTALMAHGDEDQKLPVVKELRAGDSFGELALLGIEKSYGFTVEAVTNLEMYAIPTEEFLKCFKGMTDILARIKANLVAATDLDLGMDAAKKLAIHPYANPHLNPTDPGFFDPLNNKGDLPHAAAIQAALDDVMPHLVAALHNRLLLGAPAADLDLRDSRPRSKRSDRPSLATTPESLGMALEDVVLDPPPPPK